jgi:hypothetical protein
LWLVVRTFSLNSLAACVICNLARCMAMMAYKRSTSKSSTCATSADTKKSNREALPLDIRLLSGPWGPLPLPRPSWCPPSPRTKGPKGCHVRVSAPACGGGRFCHPTGGCILCWGHCAHPQVCGRCLRHFQVVCVSAGVLRPALRSCASGPGLSRAAFISGALWELSVALCRGNVSLCQSGAYVATRAAGRTAQQVDACLAPRMWVRGLGSALLCAPSPCFVACVCDCTEFCFRLAGLFFRLPLSIYVSAVACLRQLSVNIFCPSGALGPRP